VNEGAQPQTSGDDESVPHADKLEAHGSNLTHMLAADQQDLPRVLVVLVFGGNESSYICIFGLWIPHGI